jgi:uridylate kinase
MSKAGKYGRILLKVSGEALMGSEPFGISPPVLKDLASGIGIAVSEGIQVALVVGGGNIFRGMKGAAAGMDRATADHMGMLATIMNALALQDALLRAGVAARTLSAVEVGKMTEPFIRARAIGHLEKGRVVILAAGTGNPYFTTDTAAVLRSLELKVDILMKGTSVDGIYNKDPKQHSDAIRYDAITHQAVLEQGLRFMDATAIALARDAGLLIRVFNMRVKDNIICALRGENIGSLVTGEEHHE